jgi:hypothetical protein
MAFAAGCHRLAVISIETYPSLGRNEMKVVREEIFGPVVCAQAITDDDLDAIARQANSTNYGLAASMWTSNISKGEQDRQTHPGRHGLDQLPQCLRRIPSLRRLQGVRLGA